jgi:hypothetical protein
VCEREEIKCILHVTRLLLARREKSFFIQLHKCALSEIASEASERARERLIERPQTLLLSFGAAVRINSIISDDEMPVNEEQ